MRSLLAASAAPRPFSGRHRLAVRMHDLALADQAVPICVQYVDHLINDLQADGRGHFGHHLMQFDGDDEFALVHIPGPEHIVARSMGQVLPAHALRGARIEVVQEQLQSSDFMQDLQHALGRHVFPVGSLRAEHAVGLVIVRVGLADHCDDASLHDRRMVCVFPESWQRESGRCQRAR